MPDATVVIATRNRLAQARRAVAGALAQTGAEVEVLVLDDASDDGSAATLGAEHPAARVLASARPIGAAGQRNRAAQLARGRILVSLDDDAELPSPDTVAQTLDDFDDERIGAVAIPLRQPAHGERLFQAAPDAAGTWCTFPFIAAAAAVRRDVWLAAGGYRPNPAPRANEEVDLALRMLDAGFVVRLGRADPAVHHEAPDRDWSRIWRWDTSNELLHAWWYAPHSRLPARLAQVGANALRLGLRTRRPAPFLRGLASGVGRMRGPRTPISAPAWDAALALSRAPRPLAELGARLPEPDLDRLCQPPS